MTTAHPALMLQISRTILSRLGRSNATTDRARSIVVAVTAPLDTRLVVTRLAHEMARHGTTEHLWAARVDARLGREGLVEAGLSVNQPALLQYVHEAETAHDYLVLEADSAETRWTRLAMSLADRVVVVSSADPDRDEQRRIEELVGSVPQHGAIERWLALVHRADTERPSGGAALADRFEFDRVVHLRAGAAADVARLARLVSGNATGLVLGGGGARGFAHLGVWRALRELDVDVDVVGGTSIGAAMGVLMAMGLRHDRMVAEVVRQFRGLLDYTVPVVSLIKGERISRNIAATTAGADARDMWLPFFCVSTNLTRSRVEVHDRGDVATAIRASVAIPGILPPVVFGGDLLVDGGVLNNLPCDVMRASGTVRRLIAVDLSPPVGPQARGDFGHAVSGWRALGSRLRRGRSNYPGLMSTLMRSLIAGSVRERDRFVQDGTVDWYLDLDLRGVGLLDFERVEETAARGYESARPRIEALLAEGPA
jgi:predicted acylesterase/phospholipase RssA